MAPDRSSEASTGPDDLTPNLLVAWNSRTGVFFRNLRDSLLPRRELPLEVTAEPAFDFWSDLFVQYPSRLRWVFDSYAGHVLFVLIVYGLSTSPLFQRRPQKVLDPFANTRVEYYPVSPYLPPVATPPKPAKHALEGQAALAKQEIISVPPEPDNSRQTIVTPDLRILRKEIPLPNVMVWGDKPAPIQPLSASANLAPPKLLLPPDVIAPAPENVPLSSRSVPQVQPDVIRPAADLPANAKTRAPSALTPSVVPPPPSADALHRPAGTMNIASLSPEVAAPKLPAPVQRSSGEPGGASTSSSGAAAAPAAPSMQGLGAGKPQGRMLALSVQPTEIKGPIDPPQGSRKGIFAAGPTGKEGAPGTPSIPGGGVSELGGPGKGTHDPLEGIYVGPPPDPKAPVSPAPSSELRKALVAAMHAPADIPRPRASGGVPSAPPSKIENEVFGNRKFYSMVLNMPNLTSAVGSWIVRYAELVPTRDSSDLSAPVALNKVDPAYPAELLRDRVQGTVILYAVIRANDTVDSIRVLDSVDKRLDESAMHALARWRFRPGTKQGIAVDVEAVVQVPFRAEKWKQ